MEDGFQAGIDGADQSGIGVPEPVGMNIWEGVGGSGGCGIGILLHALGKLDKGHLRLQDSISGDKPLCSGVAYFASTTSLRLTIAVLKWAEGFKWTNCTAIRGIDCIVCPDRTSLTMP